MSGSERRELEMSVVEDKWRSFERVVGDGDGDERVER